MLPVRYERLRQAKCKVTRSNRRNTGSGLSLIDRRSPISDATLYVHVHVKYSGFQLDCNYVVYEAMHHGRQGISEGTNGESDDIVKQYP